MSGTTYVYPSPASGNTYIVEQDNGTWFTRLIFDGSCALANATTVAEAIASTDGNGSISFSQGETIPIVVPSPSPGY